MTMISDSCVAAIQQRCLVVVILYSGMWSLIPQKKQCCSTISDSMTINSDSCVAAMLQKCLAVVIVYSGMYTFISATRCSTLQYTAKHCNTLQIVTPRCHAANTASHYKSLAVTSCSCSMLQYVNILQHNATHSNTLPSSEQSTSKFVTTKNNEKTRRLWKEYIRNWHRLRNKDTIFDSGHFHGQSSSNGVHEHIKTYVAFEWVVSHMTESCHT